MFHVNGTREKTRNRPDWIWKMYLYWQVSREPWEGPGGRRLRGLSGSSRLVSKLLVANASNVTAKAISPTLKRLSNVAAINHLLTVSVCQNCAARLNNKRRFFRQIALSFFDRESKRGYFNMISESAAGGYFSAHNNKKTQPHKTL